MSAEYNGKMDEDKTVPILPRPLRKPQHRIRAENLTGDPEGNMPTDDLYHWQGLVRENYRRLDDTRSAQLARDEEIDELWF